MTQIISSQRYRDDDIVIAKQTAHDPEHILAALWIDSDWHDPITGRNIW